MLSKINWKVRVKNPSFWVGFIPAVLLIVQQVLIMFGINFDYTVLSEKLTAITASVFVVLAMLGIVVDPTTHGVGDSCKALEYDEPRVDTSCDCNDVVVLVDDNDAI